MAKVASRNYANDPYRQGEKRIRMRGGKSLKGATSFLSDRWMFKYNGFNLGPPGTTSINPISVCHIFFFIPRSIYLGSGTLY